MGLVISNGVAANQEATFNTSGEQAVTLTQAIARAGFSAAVAENDDGTVTGSRYLRNMEVSEDFRLRVGMDTSLFQLSFEGSVIASDRVAQAVSTQTISQTNNFLTLNSGVSTVSGGYSIMNTYRSFPLYATTPLYFETWIRETNYDATNAITEFGIGYAATTATPTDGVFIRRISGGALRLVLNFAGAETTTNLDPTSAPGRDGVGSYNPTESNHWVISINSDEVEVWLNDARLGKCPVPAAQACPASSMAGRAFFRTYATGTMSTARQLGVGYLGISLGDTHTSKDWGHQLCGMGNGAYQTQPGNAVGPTVSRASANFGWPASTTALTVGTWTATSAPAAATLGGRWISPAISTLTSEADYPVFAYQNPAGTAALPGKTLYITSVRVGESIAMAAASTNGILLCYALQVGGTSATTSTADAATSVAGRIIPLGQCYFASTAVIGTTCNGFDINFPSPLVVPASCYCSFIVRPVGTVTSNTLTVTGMVTFNGYFE